jgi:hypothetical protein
MLYNKPICDAKSQWKVNQIPVQAWTGAGGSQISRQSVREAGKVVTPMPLPQEIFLVL